MGQPVWSLSVDLQTKTATFQSGLGEAAKAARGSFQEIRDSAKGMGDGVREASGSVNYSMMEARHGVMMLGEEFGIHLPRGLTTFIASLGPVGAAMEMAFPFLAILLGATLLIEHLAKLHEAADKLADSQSNMGTTIQGVFNKLDDQLLQVGIRADELNGNHLAALKKQLELIDHQELKSLIEEFGTLDKVSTAVLTQLKSHWYEFGSGSTGATHALDEFKMKYESLLAQGKGKEAGDLLAGTLASAEKVLALQKQAGDNQSVSGGKWGDYAKYEQASLQLKQMGIGFTQKEVQAQETLTDALRAQVSVAEKIAAIGSGEKTNDRTAESQREAAGAQRDLQQRKMTIDQRLSVEESYYKKSQELATKAAKEHEKDLNLEREANEGATRAILEAQQQRAKVEEELGKEEADLIRKMAALKLQATENGLKQEEKLGRIHGQELVNAQVQAQNESYEEQMRAFQHELYALDKYGKDYEVRLKQIQNKEKELTQDHENKISEIITSAESQRKEKVIADENRMSEAFAQTAAKSIMGGKNMAQAFEQLGSQMLKTMLTNLMQLETVQGRKRFGDARTAAADAFADAGNPVLGALEGAAAFAAVMAFNEGGIVPGVERGDVVPARLTPGEAVLPKALVDGLMGAAQSGGAPGSNGDIHVHHHATYNVQAFDGDGVDRVLRDHSEKFANHMKGELRRMNR